MKLLFTTNDAHDHMVGKTSLNEPDSEARARGLYVEAIKDTTTPREHWRVVGMFCGESIFSYRCALEEQVRERAQAAVDAERELCRPATHSVDWPLAMPAPVSEATALRRLLSAAQAEADALRETILASRAAK